MLWSGECWLAYIILCLRLNYIELYSSWIDEFTFKYIKSYLMEVVFILIWLVYDSVSYISKLLKDILKSYIFARYSIFFCRDFSQLTICFLSVLAIYVMDYDAIVSSRMIVAILFNAHLVFLTNLTPAYNDVIHHTHTSSLLKKRCYQLAKVSIHIKWKYWISCKKKTLKIWEANPDEMFNITVT